MKQLFNIMQELDRAGIRFTCKKSRGVNHEVTGADIEIEPVIPVSVLFEGMLETSAINLIITNYDNLFSSTKVLDPEQITDEFLDELGKYILRKRNIFLKSTLDDEKKAEIQNMVREAEARRLKELRDAELREREELLARKNNTFMGKLKKQIKTMR